MRMSSFIIGGLVGAAAVVYFNRNNKPIMFSLSQAGESVNRMVDAAMNKVRENKSDSGLNQVKQMAEKDPEVKHEINEIMKENSESQFQTQ